MPYFLIRFRPHPHPCFWNLENPKKPFPNELIPRQITIYWGVRVNLCLFSTSFSSSFLPILPLLQRLPKHFLWNNRCSQSKRLHLIFSLLTDVLIFPSENLLKPLVSSGKGVPDFFCSFLHRGSLIIAFLSLSFSVAPFQGQNKGKLCYWDSVCWGEG